MIGKKSSLRILLRCLRILGVSHIFSTRFIQGKKGNSTVRWGVAWTFRNVLVPESVQNNMSHKVGIIFFLTNTSFQVFGLKKLRNRKDVCTEMRTMTRADFLTTIDPNELMIVHKFALLRNGADNHTIDYPSFVKYLNDNSLQADLVVPDSPSTCFCPHCVLSLSFLRVFRSLRNQPTFTFDHVDINDGKHTELEVIYKSVDGSAELCITISALLKGATSSDTSKRRRDSFSSDEEPSKKRTRIGNSAETCWENLSKSDTESEGDDNDQNCCDEWNQTESEIIEVEQIEFSVHMNPVNLPEEHVISSNLR